MSDYTKEILSDRNPTRVIYNSRSDLHQFLVACQVLILDFDGVLTDNGVYCDDEGHEAVRCDRSDSLGLDMLRRTTKIRVTILSKEKNQVVAQRAKKLKLECWQGMDDKMSILKQHLEEFGLQTEQAAYMGNDLNDLECMRCVGLPLAPADAHELVRQTASYVTTSPGGRGAVREVCELLLIARWVAEHQ